MISSKAQQFISPFKWIFVISIFAGLLLLLISPAKAELASDSDMRLVAENWLTYIVAETGDWGGSSQPVIQSEEDIFVNDTLIGRYYMISSGGYIIVPTLRELPAVKAYTDETSIGDIYAVDGFAALIREVLKSRIDMFVEQYGSLEASQSASEPLFGQANTQTWDTYAVSNKEFAESFSKSLSSTLEGVGPLLTTSWHQRSPYDALCPPGDGGTTLVGCVSTAASQIIYYHQWPPTGVGNHSYYWGGDNSCDGSSPGMSLSADFSDEYLYDYSNASMAEICYEMGVAYNMDYGVCGSGAYTLNGDYIFPQYFRYDGSAQSIYRSSYTAQSWFDIIKGQINQYHPTLYRISGHAIVCDGWRISGVTNQYHMNYGWGGSQNLWYAVDNVHCTWNGCDPMVEGMVINLIPLNGAPWLGQNEFLDINGGDGDGIAEQGETIEMVFTINNYGGGDVTDVNATLMIDDASLTILDGSTSLGLIPGRDSASNASDPFVFEIPSNYIARLDSFMIELTWNGGTEIDTLVVEKAIGGAKILLVDDDNNGGVETYYKECLTNFRSPYDIWIHSFYSPPDSAELSKYDMVIWFTGDIHYAPINVAEINSIRGYLNQGGNLVLTGQGIAEFLNTQDQTFLQTYLKTDYLSTGYVPLLTGSAGSQLFSVTDTVVIYGGGANNQTDPDHISPINGSVGEVNYFGSPDYGAVSYAGGDYNLVFMGFGFEAIRSDDPRFSGRDSCMSSLFTFFDYTTPKVAPQVSNIQISPGDKNHLINHTPDIAWDYSDNGGDPQTMYHIQVGTNTNWESAEMWDPGIVTGSATSITYGGSPLEDGIHYFLRIRVFNGSFWSGWIYEDLTMNSTPAQAVLVEPINMAPAVLNPPEFTHSVAVDSQGDNVTYTYEIYSDASLTTLVSTESLQQSGTGTITWQSSETLTEDEVFYWRVRADDDYEQGVWSDPGVFWVNGENQPPVAFDLIAPANEATLPSLLPEFIWSATSDNDPYDNVTYTLIYATVENFSNSASITGITDTAYTMIDSLTMGNTYYWKVNAIDGCGGETISSSVFSAETFIQGDANGDATVNVGDAVYLINYAFKGGPAPQPLSSGDANCDIEVNVGDAVYVINYAFKGGPPPGCN
ncbi:MAG: C10 family peptidase [candidate division Zixibacteria bacterium]|nr:C10 family peptidase [candidate division Zixibacteria bacterium]